MKNEPTGDQINNITEDIRLIFGQQLIGIVLFGSSIRRKPVLKGDIDLLIAVSNSKLEIILDNVRAFMHIQERKYGKYNRIDHAPLLLINSNLPLFGPSYSFELMAEATSLFGDNASIQKILFHHSSDPPFKDSYKSYIYWELQAACKDIVDTYVEYWANTANGHICMYNYTKRTNKRIIKLYLYGMKLAKFIDDGIWDQVTESHCANLRKFIYNDTKVISMKMVSIICANLIKTLVKTN